MLAQIRNAFLKPVEPSAADTADEPMTKEEAEAAARSMTDKERLIGLITAPVAAGISFLVTSALVANDPAKHLKGGALNPHYVNPNLYRTLELVLLGLSLVVLFASMARKRLYAGIAACLYGLALFNMHYWGFAVPFVMVGAWLITRAYRLNQDAKGTGKSSRVVIADATSAPAMTANPHRRKQAAASRGRR